LLKLAVTSDDVQLQDRFTAMRAGIILPQDDLPSFPTVKFAPKQAAYSVTYRDERGVFLYGQRYSVFRLAPNEEAAFMSTYPNGIAEQYTVYRALETEVDKNGRQEGPSSTDTWLVHR
jgi:hypothetical protein